MKKEMYVVVGKDQYGGNFIFICPDTGETIWSKEDADSIVLTFTCRFEETSYRIAKLSWID